MPHTHTHTSQTILWSIVAQGVGAAKLELSHVNLGPLASTLAPYIVGRVLRPSPVNAEIRPGLVAVSLVRLNAAHGTGARMSQMILAVPFTSGLVAVGKLHMPKLQVQVT